MHNHAPHNYNCPLCLAIQGIESDATMMKQADIFYRDDLVMAAINSKFIGNNPGHIIVFPVTHYENLYDLPEKEGNRIMNIAKEITLALKEIRKCDGTMILQNNEPASGQHAFHYHLHIFPRFEGDELHANMSDSRVATPEERKPFSSAMKEYFNK
ncbi:MAG: AP-4-A phosphorylase [Microgenomates bacterium OLB22]|nr:MAG: AP-4-A phosphorylase [Microgenomates bacterium OLB22]